MCFGTLVHTFWGDGAEGARVFTECVFWNLGSQSEAGERPGMFGWSYGGRLGDVAEYLGLPGPLFRVLRFTV